MVKIYHPSRYVLTGWIRGSGILLTTRQPRTYLFIFVACDLVNLILQGIGGGISSTQQQPKGIQAGIDIVIAGLATQVASLFIFIVCCTHFMINVHCHPEMMLYQFSHVRKTWAFRAFLFGWCPLLNILFVRPFGLRRNLTHRYRTCDSMHIHSICVSHRRTATRLHRATCQQ